MDKYQERYIAHQGRKKKQLVDLIEERHSNRVFSDEDVSQETIELLIDSLKHAPSSCDRHGVYPLIVTERDDKSLLGGILVGGVGWVHRAPVIMLLFGDPQAYKEKLMYMPYLDAGVVLHHTWLVAEREGLKCAYVNPNVRGSHQLFFRERFGYDVFCGALAIGYEKEK